MSWSETHRWWRAVREAERLADADLRGELPWSADFADVFGSRAELLRALEYRWTLIVQAQMDPELPDAVLDETWQRITSAHAGLRRVLARHAGVHPPVTDAAASVEAVHV